MSQQCDCCRNKIFLFKPNADVENEPIRYMQWQKTEKLDKVDILCTVKEAFRELVKHLMYFSDSYICKEESVKDI